MAFFYKYVDPSTLLATYSAPSKGSETSKLIDSDDKYGQEVDTKKDYQSNSP
jgi:hypothetical protein